MMTNSAASKDWTDRTQEAARKFVQTAVVIDNEGLIFGAVEDIDADTPKEAVPPSDDGLGGGTGTSEVEVETAEASHGAETSETAEEVSDAASGKPLCPEVEPGQMGPKKHQLDLQKLSDTFAEHDIICGPLVPTLGADLDAMKKRALKMATHADIVIIDWFLRDKDSSTTISLIVHLIRNDLKIAGSRTRLICIYTGEVTLTEILAQVRGPLEDAGLLAKTEDSNGDVIVGDGFRIISLNKGHGSAEDGVPEKDLPKRLIVEFAHLIDGLVPTFAAASIASVRNHANHILSVFSASLDPAYVANRAISDPPEDVAALMRSMLVSEFDSAIGFGNAANDYLGPAAIDAWLKKRNQPTREYDFQNGKKIDRTLLKWMCRNGFEEGKKVPHNGQMVNFNNKTAVAKSLAATDSDADKSEEMFAMLATNKREFFGRRGDHTQGQWSPSLGLGTIITRENKGKEEFFVCITPACDAVRLAGDVMEMAFLNLREADANNKKFNLVVPVQENASPKRFMVSANFQDVIVVRMKIYKATRSVQGKLKNGRFVFRTKSRAEYAWLAELRSERAQRDLQRLTNNWSRIGIVEHEWLRLNE